MAVVLTDIQVAFAVGALFADAGAPIIEAAKNHSEAALGAAYNRYMLRSLMYVGVFLAPAATVFLLAYPAWETQYISSAFDNTIGNPVNAGYYGMFLVGLFAGAWFGNWLGFRWILSGARKRLRVLYLAITAVTFAIFGARYPAPVRIGTYAAFKKDPYALPYITQDTTFFYSFIVLLLLTGLPLLIWFIRIRLSVKKLKSGSTEMVEGSLPV
jgi:hypothetical protein